MKLDAKYAPIDEEADEDEAVGRRHNTSIHLSRRTFFALVVSNITSFVCALTLLLYVFKPELFTLNANLKKTSYYSPILNLLSIPLDTVTHDNTLFHESIYRQPPSPEVDEAWFKLATPYQYLATTEDILAVGKDPAYSVRHPKKPDKHVTMLAVDHQLHCLNELRQYVFAEHYNLTHPTPLQLDHTQHCIELLRQTLTCNANLDLITYNWQDIGPDPVPDFKINMKCRNFDALREFQQRGVEESDFFSPVGGNEGWPWKRQGGERTVKAPRKWWEYLLEGGYVSQAEFERGKLDEGHWVVD